MATTNLEFYDDLWSRTHLEEPRRFNTWPLVEALVAAARERLEIGPGLRPRLPIEGTCFVDISRHALKPLRRRGARTALAESGALPFPDRRFDLVAVFDVIEHVADDVSVFRELGRVLKDEAVLVFSVPLYASSWTPFDSVVGHFRRYEPDDLERSLEEHGFELERSAVFGMQAKSGWLLRVAARTLARHRAKAMWWYNRVILPLGMYLQKPLVFESGLIRARSADEVVVVCRRRVRR